MADEEGNKHFGELHEALAYLTDLLNEPIAENAADPEEPDACLIQIIRGASAVLEAAQALTVSDFEEEYPEDEDADAIDAEVVEYV